MIVRLASATPSPSRLTWSLALFMAGHRHDRPGAVAHEHVVGDEHRDLAAGGGVHRMAADEDAGLVAGLDLPLDIGARARLAPVGGDRLGRAVRRARPALGRALGPGRRDQLVDEWVLGRED